MGPHDGPESAELLAGFTDVVFRFDLAGLHLHGVDRGRRSDDRRKHDHVLPGRLDQFEE